MDAVKLEILWVDDDVVEVRVQASNGRFAGTADCYAGHDAFARLLEAARGFPSSGEDRREWEIGTFDPGCAGGGAKLVLHCLDRVGHAVAHVTLQADPRRTACPGEAASFSLPVEAAALDEFFAALGRMSLVVGSTASLRMAT